MLRPMKIDEYRPEDVLEYSIKFKSNFAVNFRNNGFVIHEPVAVDAKVDPSVRFIASHMNTFKKYLLSEDIPEKGYCINQDCLQTHNLNILYDDNIMPKAGSFYLCQGTLSKYEDMSHLYESTMKYVFEVLSLDPKDMAFCISSKDKDIMRIVENNDHGVRVDVDTFEERKYRHRYGVEGVSGRDLNLFLKDKKGKFKSFAAIVAIAKEGKECLAELALSPFSVITQLKGYGHPLNCFPVAKLTDNDVVSKKIQDCIMTSILLYRGGLIPSNKHNCNRLLNQYVVGLRHLQDRIGVSNISLEQVMLSYERQTYGNNSGVVAAIIKDISAIKKDVVQLMIEKRLKGRQIGD